MTPIAVSDKTCLDLLGITPRQFRSWIVRAKLPSTKVGRRTLVRIEHILAALGPAPAATPEPRWTRQEVINDLRGSTRAWMPGVSLSIDAGRRGH
jgi:hypothetical protein